MKYLIVGLGNVGHQYVNTRHNVGFNVVDVLAEKYTAEWCLDRLAYKATCSFKGKKIHLIKPTTFMNLSGKAVNYWMTKLKVKPENILVVVDDLAIELGALRLRGKGNDGGHNGLKDITAVLGSNKYPRLRFGIGNDFPKGKQVDFVLGKWTITEQNIILERFNRCIEIIESFISIGLTRTMNLYNNK